MFSFLVLSLSLFSLSLAGISCNKGECPENQYCRKPLYQLCCGGEGVCTKMKQLFEVVNDPEDHSSSSSSCENEELKSFCQAKEGSRQRDNTHSSSASLSFAALPAASLSSAGRRTSSLSRIRPKSPSIPIPKKTKEEEGERGPSIAFSPYERGQLTRFVTDGLMSTPSLGGGVSGHGAPGQKVGRFMRVSDEGYMASRFSNKFEGEE
jgi:hypothetical protein